jgi:nucleotide-binding universal stress UspA family protein
MLAVVALDGGATDRDVVAAAARVLSSDRDEVRLLTVIDPSEVQETRGGTRLSGTLPQATTGGQPLPIDRPLAPAVEGRDQVVARVHGERITYLEGLAASLLGELRYRCVVEVGSPAEKIVELAEALGAGGIAMGTRSQRSRLGSAVFGSVAEQVVRQASVPVLVVKEGTAAPSAG